MVGKTRIVFLLECGKRQTIPPNLPYSFEVVCDPSSFGSEFPRGRYGWVEMTEVDDQPAGIKTEPLPGKEPDEESQPYEPYVPGRGHIAPSLIVNSEDLNGMDADELNVLINEQFADKLPYRNPGEGYILEIDVPAAGGQNIPQMTEFLEESSVWESGADSVVFRLRGGDDG